MNRILSAVFVTVGVALLVWSLVVSLRPGHPVETNTTETKVVAAAAVAGLAQSAGPAMGEPTLAPPRPASLESPHDAEPGVAYVTVEVELAETPAP